MKTAMSRARARGVVAAGIITFTLVLATGVRAAEEDKEAGTVWKECMDKAFAHYNSCLMESDGWFHRKVCDLAFELDAVACAAKAAGTIRNAWNGL
jgi:hypothetical protein